MHNRRHTLLACAVACAAWFFTRAAAAQDIFADRLVSPTITNDIPIPVNDLAPPIARQAESSVTPTGTLWPSAPANHESIEDALLERPIYACACGCGVFDVATSSMLPHGQGGMAWFEWDYQNQNQNRRGTSSAPSADNTDKDIRTDFFTFGFQYFFDRKWGVQVQVPVDHRHFASAGATFDWTTLGDIRVKGLYTGFLEDQSIGVDFGVKLANGNFTHPGPDRDTEIGTGSTDILLGGFYRTNLSADHNWNFFAQIESELPAMIQDQYRPGFEFDGAAGIYYSGFSFHGVTISPVGQLILSYRTSDTGANSAHPIASGYQRVLLSPGIEFHLHPFSIYANVEIPVFHYFRGDQLAAPALFKVIFSYNF